MIELWWAAVATARSTHVALLDDDERGRHAALRFAPDRRRLLAGAALARIVVGHRVGVAPERLEVDRSCDRCGRAHGRPRLRARGGPVWSVSHSGDHVVVAVADAVGRGALGVDLERVDADRPPPRDFVLSEVERREGADLWAAWVRKEAVLKATGEGLRRAMTTVTVGRRRPGSAWRRVDVASRPDLAADVVDLDAPVGHVAAVAVVGELRAARAVDLAVHHRDGDDLLAVPMPEEMPCPGPSVTP